MPASSMQTAWAPLRLRVVQDKVYGADDSRVVRVEPFSPQGLALFVVHTMLDAQPRCYGSRHFSVADAQPRIDSEVRRR
jgi:hypothetical protein